MFQTCEECFELIDDARDCLRECNSEPYYNFAKGEEDGTILNECLDPNREDRDQGTINPAGDSAASVDNVEDIKDLVDCCEDGLDNAGVKWDKDCRDTFEQVEACLVECFDGCLTATTEAWFQCVQDETGNTKKDSNDLTGSDSCSRQSCLSGFLDEEEGDTDNKEGNELDETFEEALVDGDLIDISKSEDIFDLETVAEMFEEIGDSDLQDCSALDNFIDSACRVSDTCCEDCNVEMAASLDCLLNSIVAPFVAAATNVTSVSCPVDEECAYDSKDKRSRRDLHSKTLDALHTKGHFLPRSSNGVDLVNFFETRRLEGTAGTSDDVQFCISQMNRNILAHNMTHATNKYMECTTAAALSRLEDAPESGSASAALSFLAFVASFIVALL
jgi:hypothetical protein